MSCIAVTAVSRVLIMNDISTKWNWFIKMWIKKGRGKSAIVFLKCKSLWGYVTCTTCFRSIALIPEEPEDMWHAYNLISEGDSVRASTVRKVQTESATGSSTSNRVRTTLTISVENIDFDTQACMLRLKGRNLEENQYVKVKTKYLLFNIKYVVHWE